MASTEHVGIPLLFLFSLLLFFYPIRYAAIQIVGYIKVKHAYKHKQYHMVASYYYHNLFVHLYKNDKNMRLKYSQTAPKELVLPETIDLKKEDYISLLEKALYSQKGLTKEEIDQFISWSKQAIKLCKHNVTVQ